MHTDGNGIAGLLQEVFVAEITSALHVCGGCGEQHAIGEHRAYSGAGKVLRCPHCGAVAATVVETPGEVMIGFTGVWRVPRAG